MSDDALGQHIRDLRLARGLSQEALAAGAGIHVQTLSRIERGTHSPSVEHALAIARALDVGAQAFFGPVLPAPPSETLGAIEARLMSLPESHLTRVLRIIDLYIEGTRD